MNDFNFTIALVPDNMNLDKEIQYIKSALLYADKVTLISPMAYLYVQLTDEKNLLNERTMIKLLDLVMPFCQSADPALCNQFMPVFSQFKSMILGKQYRSVPYAFKIQLKQQLREFAQNVNDVMKGNIGERSCQEINSLLKSGKLTLQKFEHSLGDVDGCISEYFNLLQKSVKQSFPLFDEQSNDLMRSAVREKVVDLSDTEKRKITHAGLSNNYIQRLPSFEAAPIDEILDIRKELDTPLVRFRSKMLNYSDSIQTLPWDSDFEDECSLLFNTEVAPSILEIEELTKDNSFIRNVSNRFATDEAIVKYATGMFFGIAAAGVISTLSQTIATDTALLTAGTAVTATKIASAYAEYSEKKKEIQRKDLFFYYKAGKILNKKIRN